MVTILRINGKFVTITGGVGAGQRRKISDYTGASKVALVSEAWTTNPDNTSTYTINKGGGIALYKGAYRTSRYHTFTGYESTTNGAGEIIAEDGGMYSLITEAHSDLVDAAGYNLTMGSANAFTTGTGSRVNFQRRVLGQPAEMASIREVTTGAEGSSTGALAVFTRKAGVAPTETFRITDGMQINAGAVQKKQLMAVAALNFPSVAAQSSQALTATVTGAAEGDIVTLGLPNAGVHAGLAIKAYVSAANTVTVLAMNYTAGAIDPGNLSFRIVVEGY